MRALLVSLAGLLLLGACRVPLAGPLAEQPPTTEEVPAPTWETAAPEMAPGSTREATIALGEGAAPGNADGPGGFVSRGSARNFYAGAGGRLWYYMNNYYWVSETSPRGAVWIKAVVVEEFRDLRRWPDGTPVQGPAPKVTVEYWEVARSGRSVRLDNHRDYCLLSDHYTAGRIVVEVTLTLGRLSVKDEKGKWVYSKEAYVLESRNYRGGGGIGADRARFRPLASEAVTVWGYEVPWSTHPQRLTRSSWQRLELPEWSLLERRAP